MGGRPVKYINGYNRKYTNYIWAKPKLVVVHFVMIETRARTRTNKYSNTI